jgi:hypothetical protein
VDAILPAVKKKGISDMNKLILIAGCFMLVSCTGKKSPTSTVNAFFEAVKKGDQSGLMAYLQKKDREFLEKMESRQAGKQSLMPAEGADYSIGDETINGETAMVAVTVVQAGKQKTERRRLVQEDGQWRIDLFPDEYLQMIGQTEGLQRALGKNTRKGPEKGTAGKGSTR